MQGVFAYAIAIIIIVIVINFVMLRNRLRRDKPRKKSKPAMDEEKAARLRNNEIQRRINREQEDMASYVEKRNKTLQLYAEVRKRAAEREKQEALKSADNAEYAQADAEEGAKTDDNSDNNM